MDDCVERIFALCSAKGLSNRKLADLLGITDKKVNSWKTGSIKSYRDYLEPLSEVLETTTDYILKGTESGPVSTDGLSAEALELAAAFDRADSNVQDAVRAILRPFRKCEPCRRVM